VSECRSRRTRLKTLSDGALVRRCRCFNSTLRFSYRRNNVPRTLSIIGVYSVNFSSIDIWIMVISGAAGYVLRKFGYEMAPLLLALVLGDRLEENFRLALTMSGGN
jgi:hypothetical protein